MLKHIKKWWYWQKRNGNGFFYKILVLFGIMYSPTFYQIWTPDEAKAFHDGFMKGLNSYKEAEVERKIITKELSKRHKTKEDSDAEKS